MRKITAVILALLTFLSSFACIAGAADIMPSTWAATDGLGRTLTLDGNGKRDKYVGLFYWTWHTNFANSLTPKNATEILKEHPEILYDFNSPLWEPEVTYPDGRPFFWDEPIWGYYTDTDAYILRKNAELIADAGVDVILFDCTNGTSTWDDACLKLFEIFEEAKDDGVNVPKIAYILPFAASEDSTTSLRHLYNDIYSKGLYKDLWFYWEGKPLIMAHSSQLNKSDETEKAILDFFTFRKNEPSYFVNNTKYSSKTWGWCSDYPQSKYGTDLKGGIEQMCVSVAQNAAGGELSAMSANRDDVQGRSFTKGGYSYTYSYGGKDIVVNGNTKDSLLYGLNFQQQWDRAIECDPDFIFVTGWNEWIAGRWEEWMGTANAFPDQFSPEFSRDIEPSKGVLKDYYYYQLADNIRRYKGADVQPENKANKTIDISGGFAQWENVLPEYNHYTGSTRDRDSVGWVGTHYENHSMRNDIVSSKVAYDDDNIYFLVTAADELSPSDDEAWMRLFIDTDTSGISPNWESFEYVINRSSPQNGSVSIEKSIGGWSFESTGSGRYTVNGKVLQIEVPRSALSLDGTKEVKFNFKWSDNMQSDGDIMDFYTNGDVAPGGRFTFVFDSTATGEIKEENGNGTLSFFSKLLERIKAFFVYIFSE